MTVAHTEPQPPEISVEEAARLGIEIPSIPAFYFGPTTWNYLYYAILGISTVIGMAAFVQTGEVTDGLFYFFFSLLGTAVLGIFFLSSVVIPLYMKHYERLVEARKAALRAAQIAAIERAEEERAQRQKYSLGRHDQGEGGDLNAAFQETGDESELPSQPAIPAANAVEDQASSLRRMVATH